jgi:APA family basic amino acid/polyamine antiporter
MTLALVVGNLIGSGIYLLPATLAPLGANQLAGWVITIAGSLCMATVFARLSARQPLPGGPFAYVMQQFGPGAGFAAAWAYWTMVWTGNGALAVAVVSNLSLPLPWLGHTPGAPAALAVGVVWLLTLVNIRGVRGAGDVQLVTTALKLVPLVGLIGLALWLMLSGTPHVAQPPVALSPTLIASAAGLTFWGFLGLESATVPSDKVENAGRVVPRATLWGVVLAGLIYLGIALAFQAYMPQDAAAHSLPRWRNSSGGGWAATFPASWPCLPRSARSARSTALSWCRAKCLGPWRATGCFPPGSARKPAPARRSTHISSRRCC